MSRQLRKANRWLRKCVDHNTLVHAASVEDDHRTWCSLWRKHINKKTKRLKVLMRYVPFATPITCFDCLRQVFAQGNQCF